MLPVTDIFRWMRESGEEDNHSFVLNEEGASGLDLALLCPLILALSLTVIDLGRFFITDSLLRSSLVSLAGTSSYQEDASSDELTGRLFQIAEERASGWIDRGSLSVSLVPAPNGEASIDLYRVSYQLTSVSPLTEGLLGAGVFHQDIQIPDFHSRLYSDGEAE